MESGRGSSAATPLDRMSKRGRTRDVLRRRPRRVALPPAALRRPSGTKGPCSTSSTESRRGGGSGDRRCRRRTGGQQAGTDSAVAKESCPESRKRFVLLTLGGRPGSGMPPTLDGGGRGGTQRREGRNEGKRGRRGAFARHPGPTDVHDPDERVGTTANPLPERTDRLRHAPREPRPSLVCRTDAPSPSSEARFPGRPTASSSGNGWMPGSGGAWASSTRKPERCSRATPAAAAPRGSIGCWNSTRRSEPGAPRARGIAPATSLRSRHADGPEPPGERPRPWVLGPPGVPAKPGCRPSIPRSRPACPPQRGCQTAQHHPPCGIRGGFGHHAGRRRPEDRQERLELAGANAVAAT